MVQMSFSAFLWPVEGGYIQAWSIASFANFWLSIIIIITILKKLHIAPDKLHECSTITEVISHCVLQKLLPTISFKRLLTLDICSQTQRSPLLMPNPDDTRIGTVKRLIKGLST